MGNRALVTWDLQRAASARYRYRLCAGAVADEKRSDTSRLRSRPGREMAAAGLRAQFSADGLSSGSTPVRSMRCQAPLLKRHARAAASSAR